MFHLAIEGNVLYNFNITNDSYLYRVLVDSDMMFKEYYSQIVEAEIEGPSFQLVIGE